MAVMYGNLKTPFRFHRLAAKAEFTQPARVHVRLARRDEVPHVLTLIQQQAEYHGVREKCLASEANLEAGLFTQPAFNGPTVLFLELPPSSFNSLPAHPVHQDPSLELAFLQKSEENPFPRPPLVHQSEANPASSEPTFAEKYQEDPCPTTAFVEKDPSPKTAFPERPLKSLTKYLVNRHGIAHNIVMRAPIEDPDALAFQSAEGGIIAGFVLFFPRYISFTAKYGFYIEDVYVRECMRGHGFGTILFKSVAQLAVELDYCTLEWCVLDWNEKAMKLYEGMGASKHPERRLCSLSDEKLLVLL